MSAQIKERPILFTGAMVRALLDGSKTQTRRMITMPASWDSIVYADWGDGWWPFRSDDGENPSFDNNEIPLRCPYGYVGERMWVRETFAEIDCRLTYKADVDDGAHCVVQRWIPSIHMPRWASRILLDIVSVRVERLQDISEADAMAEGIKALNGRFTFNDGMHESRTPQDSYRALWDAINGADSWDANPWVWVVEFKRVTP